MHIQLSVIGVCVCDQTGGSSGRASSEGAWSRQNDFPNEESHVNEVVHTNNGRWKEQTTSWRCGEQNEKGRYGQMQEFAALGNGRRRIEIQTYAAANVKGIED